jgi:hypothetical protein
MEKELKRSPVWSSPSRGETKDEGGRGTAAVLDEPVCGTPGPFVSEILVALHPIPGVVSVLTEPELMGGRSWHPDPTAPLYRSRDKMAQVLSGS